MALTISDQASTPGVPTGTPARPPELPSPINSSLGDSWNVPPGPDPTTVQGLVKRIERREPLEHIIHSPREDSPSSGARQTVRQRSSSSTKKRDGSLKSSRSGSGSEPDKYKVKFQQASLEKTELQRRLELAQSQLSHLATKGAEQGMAWESERAIRLDAESQVAAVAAAAQQQIQQTEYALLNSEREKQQLWEKSIVQSEQAATSLQAAFGEIQSLRGEQARILNESLLEFEKQKRAAVGLEEGINARDAHIAKLVKQIESYAESQKEHANQASSAERQFRDLQKLFNERGADLAKTIHEKQSELESSRKELKKVKDELAVAVKKIAEMEKQNAEMITTSQFEMYIEQLMESSSKLKVKNQNLKAKVSDYKVENENFETLIQTLKLELEDAKRLVKGTTATSGVTSKDPVAGAKPGAATDPAGTTTCAFAHVSAPSSQETKKGLTRRAIEGTERICQSIVNRFTSTVASESGSSAGDEFASLDGGERSSPPPGLGPDHVPSRPALPAVRRSTDSVASEQQSQLTTLERGNRGTKATELRVPKFPTYAEIGRWLNRVARNVWSISETPGDKAEIAWVMQVQEKSYEELADSGEERFATMDALLVMALEKIIPPDLNRIYQDKQDEAIKDNRVVLGRQLLWLILNSFRTPDHMGLVYSYDNLMSMEWYGDSSLEQFKSSWHRMVDNLTVEPKLSNNALRDILHKKMTQGNTKIFADDLKHYSREKGKSQVPGAAQREDYSYEFLLSIIDREIRQKAEDKQVEARKRSTRRPGRDRDRDREQDAAPAPKVKAKAKPRGKSRQPRKEDEKPPKTEPPPKSPRDKSPGRQGSDKAQSPRDRGTAEVKYCFFYHHHLHDSSKPKCTSENCKFTHGPKLSKEKLATVKRGSRSRSPSARKEGDVKKDWYIDPSGIKKPKHCGAYLSGKCDYEKDSGKKCRFPHLSQAQYDKKLKELAAG